MSPGRARLVRYLPALLLATWIGLGIRWLVGPGALSITLCVVAGISFAVFEPRVWSWRVRRMERGEARRGAASRPGPRAEWID
jgi:hypothetical protein